MAMSMHPVKPTLNRFTVFGIHTGVDIYAIFCFVPKHNLSLGVNRILYELLKIMFRDHNRITRLIGSGSHS